MCGFTEVSHPVTGLVGLTGLGIHGIEGRTVTTPVREKGRVQVLVDSLFISLVCPPLVDSDYLENPLTEPTLCLPV